MSSEPDKRAFSLKLLGQTAVVWATSGFISGATVSVGACGVPMVLAAATAVLGLLFIGGLAVAGPPDRWHLLRWVNHFLQRTFVVLPFFIGLGMVLLLSAIDVMFPGLQADDRLASAKSADMLLVRSAILLSLVVGVAAKLTRVWEKVRDSDLPTDLKQSPPGCRVFSKGPPTLATLFMRTFAS